jgi:hypothetical protein
MFDFTVFVSEDVTLGDDFGLGNLRVAVSKADGDTSGGFADDFDVAFDGASEYTV